MNGRAQLFSLDFLVSLVAATVAIGLLIQAMEVRAYSQKEDELHAELRLVAETAADLIVAGNDTTCVDAAGIMLVNCVLSSADGMWEAQVPSGYGCEIEAGALEKMNCGAYYAEGDFYEVKRRVVIDSGRSEEELKLRVWRE